MHVTRIIDTLTFVATGNSCSVIMRASQTNDICRILARQSWLHKMVLSEYLSGRAEFTNFFNYIYIW